jgi:hypothetical protein
MPSKKTTNTLDNVESLTNAELVDGAQLTDFLRWLDKRQPWIPSGKEDINKVIYAYIIHCRKKMRRQIISERGKL